MTVRPDPKMFKAGVYSAKKLGGTFSGETKLWTVDDVHYDNIVAAGYSLIVVSGPAKINLATTYVGQASMDTEDSIF